MQKHKGTVECLPWYRAHNYDGNLTEAEKRRLDAFRMQPKHPAARNKDLPREVQSYICAIEFELYDTKQEKAAFNALFCSFIGAVALALCYSGQLITTPWGNAFFFTLLVFPWFFYMRQWKKNAVEFPHSGKDSPNCTDEAIRKEWELNYLVDSKRQKETD